MLRHLYRSSNLAPNVPFESGYYKYQVVESVDDGQLVRKSEIQYYDTVKFLSQFQSSDFAIANLMAVGSYKESPVIMSPSSDMTFVDQFSRSVSSIKKEVQNA